MSKWASLAYFAGAALAQVPALAGLWDIFDFGTGALALCGVALIFTGE